MKFIFLTHNVDYIYGGINNVYSVKYKINYIGKLLNLKDVVIRYKLSDETYLNFNNVGVYYTEDKKLVNPTSKIVKLLDNHRKQNT